MNLSNLRDTILAEGIVDEEEVRQIRAAVYADSKIDSEEAVILFEINNAVSGDLSNSPLWGDLFVKAISDFVLQDDETPGVVDDVEAQFLVDQIGADGQYDDLEKRLIETIRTRARSVSPILDTLK